MFVDKQKEALYFFDICMYYKGVLRFALARRFYLKFNIVINIFKY